MTPASASARVHECTGPAICRRCAGAYFGCSADWFDDHVRDAIPMMEVEGRARRWRRVDLDCWLRERTERLRDDAREPHSPSTGGKNAPAGGSSSWSRGRGTAGQLRAPIGERLPNGRRPSGKKRKRGQGSRLSLVPLPAPSEESQTISSSESEATDAPLPTSGT